jgi:hypothetical protein
MNILLATLYHFAATYSCGAYGAGNYDDGSCSTSGDGGLLANTGFLVAAVITAACVLIFVTLLVRISRKNKKK